MTTRSDQPTKWLVGKAVLAIHDRQLSEHGGSSGIKDHGALESALARPVNQALYGEPDHAALAAAYAFGIAKNHPFVDGNKRTAWVAARLFLAANGRDLEFAKAEAVTLMEGVAAGLVDETGLAQWFRTRLKTS
tara:strand:- start:75 stop:476 length:402 start_codon:yes stop_codon:yes gene_type:complete